MKYQSDSPQTLHYPPGSAIKPHAVRPVPGADDRRGGEVEGIRKPTTAPRF